MVKKRARQTARSSGPVAKRHRRTDEELIRDLQEKIRQVRERRGRRELQASPPLKAALGVVRAIDKALEKSAEAGDTLLRHVLADARKPLAQYLEGLGFGLPKARLPRGRRPKGESDEQDGAEE
jgi:hypothetical protein